MPTPSSARGHCAGPTRPSPKRERCGGPCGPWSRHFGPLIGRAVELLRGYDERELAAIRGFLTGVREAAADDGREPRHNEPG